VLVSVVLTQPYTDTALAVSAGEEVSISTSGILNYAAGRCFGNCVSTPNGLPCPSGVVAMVPTLPCWSLIGKIGATGAPFEVGSSAQFAAAAGGELFLGVNDNYFSDNTGSWTSQIAISAPGCAITSETEATLPADRARTRLGVGEVVTLRAKPRPVTWAMQSGAGSVTPGGLFTAPFATDTSVVTATPVGGAPCSITFSTVEPSGLHFYYLANLDYGYQPTLDRLSFHSAVLLTPGDVSFKNIRLRELDSANPAPFALRKVLVPVNGTQAWLADCDFVAESSATQYDTYWAFEDPAGNHSTSFSLVQTQRVDVVGANTSLSRGQIEALSNDGTFAGPADSPAMLTIPSSSPAQKVSKASNGACEQAVAAQFGA
jgi:hypothetical protein